MARRISWQVIVETAGEPVSGPDISSQYRSNRNDFYIQALPSNAGLVACGNDGEDTVSLETGFLLQPGRIIPWNGNNLNEVFFDAEENGDGVCIWVQ